jgi:predicted enzyme related to lactoylglutathione lyase
MITAMTYTSLWVLDYESARRFYTEKLDFEVSDDVTMDNGYRWLTVAPKGQQYPALVLNLARPPMLDEESAAMIRTLMAKGALGAGVMGTDDCRATYAELSARGVEFLQEPAERPYGVEALFRDDSGNWFSLTQRH